MVGLDLLRQKPVFRYFEEISSIPRGSGNMNAISEYCMRFAEKHSLSAVRDSSNNVIIFKNGSRGYENSEPVILQGHLDMVCCKTEESDIDFEKDGLRLYTDGDFIKADGTTLGADNGIAAAMILAVLESDSIPHPPIEAVFTTDEEIGMLGAVRLPFEKLKGKRMINLDSEEGDTVTVSCAGGCDFSVNIPCEREKMNGTKMRISIRGLKGGHSGVEINNFRTNAAVLAGRILNYASGLDNIGIISADSGSKGNAIADSAEIIIVASNPKKLEKKLEEYISVIRGEIADRENAVISAVAQESGTFDVFNDSTARDLIYFLNCVPNGVQEMSCAVEGLVETSLNLGILNTADDNIKILMTLRSNKKSALRYLEEKIKLFSSGIKCTAEASGHYPPWEYRKHSPLREKYIAAYRGKFGDEPKTEAIHAGLECGVFADAIENLDCIAIGPQLYDVHTVNERCSISSTEAVFELLCTLLKNCG